MLIPSGGKFGALSRDQMMVAYDPASRTAPFQHSGEPMRKTLLPMACAAFVALSASVLADDREDCSSIDVDRMIRGCTGVINSRQELRQTLAIAYHRRGTAFASKKEYDRAIADYTKAIEIDPKHVGAYNDRGLAYTSKGDYERAIADVIKAVELTARPTPQPKTIALTPPPAGETAKTEPSPRRAHLSAHPSPRPSPKGLQRRCRRQRLRPAKLPMNHQAGQRRS